MTDGFVALPKTYKTVRKKYIKLSQQLGYLSGDFPDAITKVEGVPTQTEILVFIHRTKGEPGDGKLVARVTTGQSGAWRVDGLNTNLRYDVVCRFPTYKDEILSNVLPYVD